MSSRAAWRLARFGFEVYDYVGGKADWLAAGLPSVRAERAKQRAAEAAESPPTSHPDTPASQLADGPVVVVNERSIVLGRIDADRDRAAGATAGELAEPGPATVRADEPLDSVFERMERGGLTQILVTTPEGRLLGVVNRGG